MVKLASILSLVFAWALALACCAAACMEEPVPQPPPSTTSLTWSATRPTRYVRTLSTCSLVRRMAGEIPASFFFAGGLLYPKPLPEPRTALRPTGRQAKGCPAWATVVVAARGALVASVLHFLPRFSLTIVRTRTPPLGVIVSRWWKAGSRPPAAAPRPMPGPPPRTICRPTTATSRGAPRVPRARKVPRAR
jgi:hypothetical protein